MTRQITINELDRVRLIHELDGMPVGARGTVVYVLGDSVAYTVEFVSPDGRTEALLDVPAASLGLVT